MKFEPFTEPVKSFFEEGFISGFKLKPDVKHTMLHQGLLDYYMTYHALRGNFYRYLQKYPDNTVMLSQAHGHNFLIRYFSSVSFIQQFIELYVKEILEEINPLLITCDLQKDEDKFLDFILEDDITRFRPQRNNKTIQFSKALSRLTLLIESDNAIPARFKVPSKFHLIGDNKEMLEHLAGIRNSIIHRGNEIMSKYAFELLFVNYIIPFITSLLRLEPKETLLDRNLFCKINVLDKLCEIKLEVNFNDTSKYEQIQKNLRHINHLKELGRASFKNPLWMGEEVSQEQFADQEKSHNKKIRLEHESQAQVNQSIFPILTCPCCGTNCLSPKEILENSLSGDLHIEWVYCSLCTYDIKKEIGEPMEFDLMQNSVFVTKLEEVI